MSTLHEAARAAFEARFPGCARPATEYVAECCQAGWEAWQARAALAASEAQADQPAQVVAQPEGGG